MRPGAPGLGLGCAHAVEPSVRATEGHPRYLEDWVAPFQAGIQPELHPGCVIIDVGGGRKPAISRSDLPEGATYIGIDLSTAELSAAPPGSYDRVIGADVTEPQPGLEGCADLVVSWQVLEHVAPLDAAISNIHSYLRPGGLLVAQLSGGRSAFALINRLIPHQLAKVVMQRLLHRDPETVFPAPYDRCTYLRPLEHARGLVGGSHHPAVPGCDLLRLPSTP